MPRPSSRLMVPQAVLLLTKPGPREAPDPSQQEEWLNAACARA